MKKKSPPPTEDTYSRVDYRRFVAWPARIQREGPLLENFLERLPAKSLLDLGCGTGEHSRFLVSKGFETLGIDSSQKMLEKASEGEPDERLRFIDGDICQLEGLVEGRFGGAVSFGNTLPHILEEASLRAFLQGLAEVLLPGGHFLFQLLNYERIIGQQIRSLPVNFRSQDDHELVFLRLMSPEPDDRILFCPSTLRFNPNQDPPVELIRSKRVELKAWQRRHLFPALERSGFAIEEVWGDMEFEDFSPENSMDLVVLARRSED